MDAYHAFETVGRIYSGDVSLYYKIDRRTSQSSSTAPSNRTVELFFQREQATGRKWTSEGYLTKLKFINHSNPEQVLDFDTTRETIKRGIGTSDQITRAFLDELIMQVLKFTLNRLPYVTSSRDNALHIIVKYYVAHPIKWVTKGGVAYYDMMLRTRYDRLLIEAREESFLKLQGKIVVDWEGDSCPICLVELLKGCEAICTPCSHVFHDHCLSKLRKVRPDCPMCRYKIPAR